jgi:hypothetical protein
LAGAVVARMVLAGAIVARMVKSGDIGILNTTIRIGRGSMNGSDRRISTTIKPGNLIT